MTDDDVMITLEVGEIKHHYQIIYQFVKKSATLASLIEDVGPDHIIPLPNIDPSTFDIIVDSLSSDEFTLDENFSVKILLQLIMGANYLELKELMETSAKAMIAKIKLAKNPEEVKKLCEIPPEYEFTEEEKKAVDDSNPWLDV